MQASPKGKIGVRFPARALSSIANFRVPIADETAAMNSSTFLSDQHWMREALFEARKCLRAIDASTRNFQTPSPNPQSAIGNPQPNDVPVGAVCVYQNRIIARAHNQRELNADPTAHAEVLALREAARVLATRHLEKVALFVTLEPCPMCAGALCLSRIGRVVFGAFDEKAGACGSVFDIARDPRLNHRPQLRGGVLEEECGALLTEFFASTRR